MSIFACAGNPAWGWPVRTIVQQNITSGSVAFNWDGKDDDGYDVEPGAYTYEVTLQQSDVNVVGSGQPNLVVSDQTNYRSNYLFLERAMGEFGQPIYDVDYDSYDDNNTPEDESDDSYIYFVRWYTLADTANTNASAGELTLYDPDMHKLTTWNVVELQDLAPGSLSGLSASSDGIVHAVRVPVSVNLMQDGGIYRFVLHFEDDHAFLYRDHKLRPTYDLNGKTPPQGIWIWIDGLNGSELQTCVDWNAVSQALTSVADGHYDWVRFTWPPNVGVGLTSGATRTQNFDIYWQNVSYKLPSTAQQDSQRQDARDKHIAPYRNIILTLADETGQIQWHERVAMTRPSPLGFAMSTVGRPSVCAIGSGSIEVCPYVDDPISGPTATEKKWLYTNAVIHELSHFLMACGNSGHCSAGIDTCIWGPAINSYWSDGILGNSVTFKGQSHSSPWHNLDEINKMRKSLGYTRLTP